MTVSGDIAQIMKQAPVIPVVVIDDVRKAVALCRALHSGGLPVIEVTLRTANALDCMKAMAAEVEGAIVGAGTVTGEADLDKAMAAGAKFFVSPGSPAHLLKAAADRAVPLLPGAATSTEMMTAAAHGYHHLKFFPAEPAGGVDYLKAISGPLPDLRFCPTGGVTPANASAYLSLDNVLCVGGSWLAPKPLVDAAEWDRISELARQATKLKAV